MAESNHGGLPPEPDQQFRYGATLVELYGVDAMLDGPSGSTSVVYENGDFERAIASVTLAVTPWQAGDRYALGMDLRVKFDESDAVRHWMERLFDRMYRSNWGYEVKSTELPDMLRVDTDHGLELRAWFRYNERELLVTNDLTRAGLADPSGRLRVAPRPLNELHGDRQLVEMSGVMASLVANTCRLADFEAPQEYVIGMTSPAERPPEPPAGQPDASPGERSSKRTRKIGGAALALPAHDSRTAPEQPAESSAERIMLDDVGGNEGLKATLREIALLLRDPAAAERWGVTSPQGVLLYGPPGTGKTMIATALANELGANLEPIQSSDIYDKWLGQSEKALKELFGLLKAADRRTVVLFDEFDSIIGIESDPGSGASSARNSAAGVFKQEMNDLALVNPNVLIVATTNYPDRIDPGLRRRFNYQLHVPAPDEQARLNIFGIILAKRLEGPGGFARFDFGSLNVPELARQSDGFTGSDITELFRRLQTTKAVNEIRTGRTEPVTQADFLRAIAALRREKPAG